MADDRRRDDHGSMQKRRDASAKPSASGSRGSDAFPVRFGAFSSGASGGLAYSVVWQDQDTES